MIQNCLLEDLELILSLYRTAIDYQKERFISHWPKFDREMVKQEIVANRQWKNAGTMPVLFRLFRAFICSPNDISEQPLQRLQVGGREVA